MAVHILERHLMWSRPNAEGGITHYYYDDRITWVVAALALAWLAWVFVGRYRRARAQVSRPRRGGYRSLRRVVKVKRELSARYLSPGPSGNIHAVGVGVLGAGGEYCIQVFISDPKQELWAGSGAETVPATYRGVPVETVIMSRSVFLSGADPDTPEPWEQDSEGIRGRREVIVGGVSGANANLAGQSGTLGYFCKLKGRRSCGTEHYIVSNCHVLADLQKPDIDDSDLITQPSPGESGSNRPIGLLVKFSALKFGGDTSAPNHIDAAIARLWGTSPHTEVIPFIGRLKCYVDKKDVRPGDPVRKFGRTTYYTKGSVFSICLDIWVFYDRTGQSAFFQDQFLIEPALPRYTSFVRKGDSGSVVSNAGQAAVGLIFAGVSDVPESAKASPNVAAGAGDGPAEDGLRRIENYGVANPISEVLARLKIELPS